MVKKGLSVEEKRVKLLEVYHSTKEVMNLKELEKHGSKAGVVMQTIKDVNQELVNDGLVDTDKIGASNFFWSFPTKVLMKRTTNVQFLKEKIADAEASLADAKRKCDELRSTRKECSARATKLQKLSEEKTRASQLAVEADQLKDNDPKELERVREQIEAAKVGINLWTDNTWAVKSYMVKKLNMTGKDADKMLGLKDDFDYVQ